MLSVTQERQQALTTQHAPAEKLLDLVESAVEELQQTVEVHLRAMMVDDMHVKQAVVLLISMHTSHAH